MDFRQPAAFLTLAVMLKRRNGDESFEIPSESESEDDVLNMMVDPFANRQKQVEDRRYVIQQKKQEANKHIF